MPNALHLIARPEGEPKDSDFELRPVDSRALNDGEARVAVRYLSVDPAMRIWMTEQKSYWPPVGLNEVMRAGGIGEIVESKNARLPVGSWVGGMTGVTEEFITEGKGYRVFDPRALPDPTWALHVFGATGFTAYFGLKEIGQAKAGETVVVSAAAGAVDSTVVQLAKAWGCHVVGIAGGADKCRYITTELGFDAAIDYKSEDVKEGLRQHCPKGIDVYFDNVGGEHLDAAIGSLRLAGRIAVCGMISVYNDTEAAPGPRNLARLIQTRGRIQGFLVGDHYDLAGEYAKRAAGWLASGELQSRETFVDGIDNAVDAFLGVLRGENTGKMVVRL